MHIPMEHIYFLIKSSPDSIHRNELNNESEFVDKNVCLDSEQERAIIKPILNSAIGVATLPRS